MQLILLAATTLQVLANVVLAHEHYESAIYDSNAMWPSAKKIKKGQLINRDGQDILLDKEYSLEFKVKPTAFNSYNWGSVLHLTQGGEYERYGDRTPAIWFTMEESTTERSLTICSAVNGNSDYCYVTSKSFTIGKWIRLKIAQIKVDYSLTSKYSLLDRLNRELGKDYLFQISINGEMVHSVANRQPQTFMGVKIYAGNPWDMAQPGFIQNIVIRTHGCEGRRQECMKLAKTCSKIKMRDLPKCYALNNWNAYRLSHNSFCNLFYRYCNEKPF